MVRAAMEAAGDAPPREQERVLREFELWQQKRGK
jgi:hypothetical protein